VKIAWVTPLAETSSIAGVSVVICDELAARGHTVHMVRAESPEALEMPARVVQHEVKTSLSLSFYQAVDDYDAFFVNIGDNYDFHGGIFEYLRHPAAIGIFHDFYLFHLFNGWRHAMQRSYMQSCQDITSVYGPDFTETAIRAVSGTMSMAEIAQTVPMTEWIAMRCAGAICHAKFYQPRLRSACAGVVEVANMPQPPRNIPRLEAKPGKVVVTTVGLANPNKCIDLVIDAFGQSDLLKEKARYVSAGPITPAVRTELDARARSQGVDFTAMGSVTEDELRQVLIDADVLVCLRRPVLEGASGSAIEALLAGRPTIVADIGFYGELPDRYVVKLPATFTVADIRHALESLVDNPEERERLGEQAGTWSQKAFSVAGYADQVENVARDQIRLTPFLKLGDRVGTRLSDLGIGPGHSSIARIAAAIDDMRLISEGSPHRLRAEQP
jgi:glycosyltransferase involved in cell wall biosynthesis